MAVTPSTMRELGSQAAEFRLPDVASNNKFLCLDDYTNKPLLLMFICNHCPFVLHIVETMVALANRYQKLGSGVLAISANDVENYPQDGPLQMQGFTEQYGFEFPYCYDESQQVALAYGAACTPDFFVYDADHKLAYRGQMDGSRPGNVETPSGKDLAAALQAVWRREPVNPQQIPSMGCGIKWKTGISG